METSEIKYAINFVHRYAESCFDSGYKGVGNQNLWRATAANGELTRILKKLKADEAELSQLRKRVAAMEQACKAVHEHAILEIEHGLPLVARPVVELMEVALALPPRKWGEKG